MKLSKQRKYYFDYYGPASICWNNKENKYEFKTLDGIKFITEEEVLYIFKVIKNNFDEIMLHYKCDKCGWKTEENLRYPLNVFEHSIEVHNKHFCKK